MEMTVSMRLTVIQGVGFGPTPSMISFLYPQQSIVIRYLSKLRIIFCH